MVPIGGTISSFTKNNGTTGYGPDSTGVILLGIGGYGQIYYEAKVDNTVPATVSFQFAANTAGASNLCYIYQGSYLELHPNILKRFSKV